MPADRIDAVVSLAKRRGFVFPSSEIYGGTRSAWDYGPLGVELKENVRRLAAGEDAQVVVARSVAERPEVLSVGPMLQPPADKLDDDLVQVLRRHSAEDHTADRGARAEGALEPLASHDARVAGHLAAAGLQLRRDPTGRREPVRVRRPRREARGVERGCRESSPGA